MIMSGLNRQAAVDEDAVNKLNSQRFYGMKFIPNAVTEKDGTVTGHFYDQTITVELPCLQRGDANFCIAVLSLMLMRAYRESGLPEQDAAPYAEWAQEISSDIFPADSFDEFLRELAEKELQKKSEFDLSEAGNEFVRQKTHGGHRPHSHGHHNRHGHRRNKI